MDSIFVEIYVNKLLIISFCDFCRCNMNKGLLEGYKHLIHIAQGGLVVNKAGLKSSDKWQNEKVQISHHVTQISIKDNTGERTSKEKKKNKKEIIIKNEGFFHHLQIYSEIHSQHNERGCQEPLLLDNTG